MPNYEHYKNFYYVAKYQNLTKAANALMTSQPSITYCIKNLEKQLGCKLFIRSKKGVTLTREGELLYSYVAPACQQLMEGERKIQEKVLLESQESVIQLGVTQNALLSHFVLGLTRFKEEYPFVQLNVTNNTMRQTLAELRVGKVDMALITTPFEMEDSFKISKVKSFKSVLVAGKKYASYAEGVYQLQDLKELPLVSLASGSTTYSLFQSFYNSHGLTMSPALEVATTELMVEVIMKEFGIGFLPEDFAKPYLERGEVVEISLCEQIPGRDIVFVSNNERPLSQAAQKLQRILELEAG